MAAPSIRGWTYPDTLKPFALLGAACWVLAVLYFATGTGILDVTGHALGRDFANFWTAGQLAAGGRMAEIFDPEAFLAAERALIHPDLPPHFWSYPPTALLMVWPLGFLPYVPALIAWTLAGTAALVPAIRRLFTDSASRRLLALAPAVAINIVLGQNGAFTAALLIGGLALLDRRPVAAGILFGLLVFKPHLGLLLPVAVIAWNRWPALFPAAATALLAVALSIFCFGLESWRAFFDLALPAQTAMMAGGTGPFLWMMTSAFASGRLLGLNGAAIFLQIPFLVFAAVMVWRGCRSKRTPREKAGLVALATFVATPQAFNYDLIPAAAAALLIAQRGVFAPWTLLVWTLPLIGTAFGVLRIPLSPLILAWGLWRFMQQTAPVQKTKRR